MSERLSLHDVLREYGVPLVKEAMLRLITKNMSGYARKITCDNKRH